MAKGKFDRTIIVTTHKGLVEWLARQGITGEVADRVTGQQVKGARVIGTVPLHLAAEAVEIATVKLSNAPKGLKQERIDLSADELEAAGARLVRYRVTALD